MVDFAIVLQPSDKLMSKLPHLHATTPSAAARSYNHSLYNPIIDRPIAVSIETKREADNFESGLFQLGIWTTAQLTRLSELLAAAGHGNTTLPVLPTLLVQGPSWHFCLASRGVERGTVSSITVFPPVSLARTLTRLDVQIIWHSISIGDSTTRLGVYTIVSVLLLLMEWTEKEFRPWFEGNVVPA